MSPPIGLDLKELNCYLLTIEENPSEVMCCKMLFRLGRMAINVLYKC